MSSTRVRGFAVCIMRRFAARGRSSGVWRGARSACRLAAPHALLAAPLMSILRLCMPVKIGLSSRSQKPVMRSRSGCYLCCQCSVHLSTDLGCLHLLFLSASLSCRRGFSSTIRFPVLSALNFEPVHTLNLMLCTELLLLFCHISHVLAGVSTLLKSQSQ